MSKIFSGNMLCIHESMVITINVGFSLDSRFMNAIFIYNIPRDKYDGGQNKVGQVLLRNLAELSKPGYYNS
jgi:hypothetical protein